MWLLALAIVVAAILVWRGVRIFNYLDHMAGIMEMIPGPTPYPFVGNMFQFGLKPAEYPKKILQYCRKYDFQAYRSLIFLKYYVMLSDPADIEKMLSNPALQYKKDLYSFLQPWLGAGLLTSSDAQWLNHQKLYAPAFTRTAIEGYLRVVNSTGQIFLAKLSQRAGLSKPFDVQDLVGQCTMDIVCKNATGMDSSLLRDEPSDLHSAVKHLCTVAQERTFSVVKRFDALFRFTPYFLMQRRGLQMLRREISEVIIARRKGRSAQVEDNKCKPFIDVLLDVNLSDSEIIEEVSTFIFKGNDPIASAVSFTIYTLSRHKDVQQKVFEEQQRIFGQDMAGQADAARLEQMHYLELVIRETLRLYPAVPLIARTNRKSIDINGTKVAKDTTVIMCLIAMGYNERYFDEPCQFRPERFEQTSNTNGALDAWKSVPFSAGPRRCIADKYAMYEIQALLSLLVRQFEILPAVDGLPPGINDHTRADCVPQSEYDPVLNFRITLKSENGIQIRLKQRTP